MADNDGNAFLFSTKRKLENNNVNNVPEHRQKLYKRDTYHIDDGAEETKVPMNQRWICVTKRRK